MRILNREEVLAYAAEGLQDARSDALAILERALAAVEPEMLVARSLAVHKGVLGVKGDPFAGGPGSDEDVTLDLRPVRAVRCIAAGKAAPAMARGLAGSLEPQETLVAAPGPAVEGPGEVVVAGHPLPDAASCRAGERALAMARATGEHDLLVVLLSGGASAALEDPLVPLDDLREVTRAMMAAGASVSQVNAVRRKLSGVKGGKLARAARGRVLALVLSDVFEDHDVLVGSGPTAPDPHTPGDALATLEMLGVEPPASVRALLREAQEAKRSDGAPVRHATNVVVGSNALAAHEASQLAAEMGYHAFRVREPLAGPAARAGWKLARMAEDITLGKAALPRPACVVYGGETTVRHDHEGAAGLGGRNQEAALAALEVLKVEGLVACLGTDGIDGPTDAAGALVDMGSKERAEDLGLDARAHLARHDSHAFFQQLGGLLRTGPTGTNVADLAVVLVP